MATQIDETAPAPLRRSQASTGNLTAPFMLGHTADLLGPVREEQHLKAAHTPLIDSLGAYPLSLQRWMDVTIAIMCLLILWPIMLAAAVLVFISSPGPVLYSHFRVGLNGEIFGCLKFRTMRADADRILRELLEGSPALQQIWKQEQKLVDDPRIIMFGHFLRCYSIDELPQLFNVLRGEMSIVGPRPIVAAEIERYAEDFAAYCLVKPGLTGLWQVSGRNRISYRRRVELDRHYVQTRSLRGDCWIILRTIPVVLRGTGC